MASDKWFIRKRHEMEMRLCQKWGWLKIVEICTYVGLLYTKRQWANHRIHCHFIFGKKDIKNRFLSRFFDRWAHETMHAYIGNKHFFTKSFCRQTYQNSKISWQKMPISDFQSDFSMSKIIRIFLIFFSLKNTNLGAHILLLAFFENSNF